MEQLGVTPVTVYAFNGSNAAEKQDFLATEEPLEIRIEYGPDNHRVIKSLSVTMRTPGADEDLVRGFLFTEGIIRHPVELMAVRVIDALPGAQEAGNIVLAQLDPAASFDIQRLDRHFYTTSSCGVCGKTSIDAVKMAGNCSIVKAPSQTLDPDIIYTLSDTLRAAQDTFTLTGGLHAAALFDFSGRLLAVREDVGRHNALDKLIGHCTFNNVTPLNDSILLLSGRASFELLQKAAIAGIAVVCAVGAPSSLAVATADAFGITLIGFLREKRFNLYTRHADLQ
ncbi:MAG: formate dehydrogenase accessory sulfurtransferase FdhD [Lewinellaceae bacterium]|nr:formate dehydrogenase accessory sulfurtransferase FdhD [Lewinellaceae bacterium]